MPLSIYMFLKIYFDEKGISILTWLMVGTYTLVNCITVLTLLIYYKRIMEVVKITNSNSFSNFTLLNVQYNCSFP